VKVCRALDGSPSHAVRREVFRDVSQQLLHVLVCHFAPDVDGALAAVFALGNARLCEGDDSPDVEGAARDVPGRVEDRDGYPA
jgi:hypothetical protein